MSQPSPVIRPEFGCHSHASVLEEVRAALSAYAGGEPPADVLRTILRGATSLARGSSSALLVNTEQFRVITGRSAAGIEEFPLEERAELVVSGPLANLMRDWEGTGRPVMLDGGGLLIVPQERGGVAIRFPGAGVVHDADRVLGLQILGDLARGTLLHATRLADVFARAEKLEETRRRLQEQTILLGELAVVDELTQLYNRRFFARRVDYEVDRFNRYKRPLSLTIFDVDFFKKVNDTHGHPAGDAVLQKLAALGLDGIRKVDLLARIGGEEFGLLMPETDGPGAEIVTSRLCARVRDSAVVYDGQTIKVTISAGIATVTAGWRGDSAGLIRIADQALYRAKESGRDRFIHTHHPPLTQ